jgi:hypothetical protein
LCAGRSGYAFGFSADPPELTAEAGSTFEGLEDVGLAVQNAINPLALATHNPMVKIRNGSIFLLSVIQSVGSAGTVTLFFWRCAIASSEVRAGALFDPPVSFPARNVLRRLLGSQPIKR